MKKLHVITKILIIYVSVSIIVSFVFYNLRIRKFSNYQEKRIITMLEKSDILKSKVGNIKKLKLVKNKLYPYKELGHWAQYEKYILTTTKGEKYDVKIIYNSEYTYGIYAYEINDELIYEDIEKVQPNITEEMLEYEEN